MHFRTVADMNSCIVNNLELIPGDIDLVVGIPRSGMLPATLIALHLNLPLTDWEGFLKGRIIPVGRTRKNEGQIADITRCRKVLVIDDSVRSGKTIKKAKEQAIGNPVDQEIVWSAVYAAPEANKTIDLYFELCPLPRIFEWCLLHTSDLGYCCVDIDGVICRDPTSDENDDGPKYLQFMDCAEPKILPSKKVGYLVTSRLEKYRAETEAWLKKHGVLYKELIMLDLPDKATRLASGSHASFKAEVYSKTNTRLFIESSYKQALKIAAISKKPVYCIENQQFVGSTSINEAKSRAQYKARDYWRLTKRKAAKLKKKLNRIRSL